MRGWVQIDAWDPVAGAAIALQATNEDDVATCMAAGGPWWPMIATMPILRYDLFDGAFGDQITAPSSSLVLQVEAWPNFARYALTDARIRLWLDLAAAPLFDGRVTGQPVIAKGQATIQFAADDRWLDTPLLTLYAGSTGAEGPASLKGTPKPLALGAPRYVAGKLIDSVNSVFQVSAYGAVQGFEAALERLARFGAPIADYASYAALVAATIPAGRWATAKAVGMARFGAPPNGQISFLVQGDAAGADGWARKPGQLIRRIAQLSGGAGKIDDASLNALDSARPYNLSVYVDQQTTARTLIQAIAASVNAVAQVSWTGKLFVVPVGLGTATVTLAADGSALPPVRSVEQRELAPPFKRLALTAERTWTVHALADIAFVDPLVDMGAYNGATTYRAGNIVQSGGSSYRYSNPTPTAGNAPPNATYWSLLASQGVQGPPGADAINNVNLLKDTGFTSLANWTNYVTSDVTLSNVQGVTNPTSGKRALIGDAAVGSAAGYRYVALISNGINYFGTRLAVQTGLQAKRLSGAVDVSTVQLVALFRAADGSVLPEHVIAFVSGQQEFPSYIRGFLETSDAPSGATQVALVVRTNFVDGTSGTLRVALTEPMISTARPGQTVFPLYAPGVVDGANGINTATINIFQRGATAPALPSATTTYDFTTSALTGLNNGWSTSIPSGTAPLWQSAATAAAQGTSDTITASEWAGAVQIAANGASAASSAPVLLYNRTSTSSAPAVPSTTVTYDFGTGVASGMNNGWTQSLPASGGAYRWQINATAVSTTGTDTIASSEWSAPQIMAQDGANGIDALSLSAAPPSVTVPCSAGGTPKAAPPSVQMTVVKGTADVTTSTAYSVSNVSNLSGVSVDAGGLVTVTGITDDVGSYVLTATKDGASAKTKIVYTKAKDGAAYVDALLDSVGMPSTTTYANMGQVSLLMGPGGTIDLDTNGGFTAYTSSVNVQGTVDYSLNGGSSWSTALSFTGDPSLDSSSPGGWASSGSLSGSSIGLSTKQTVLFRIMLRKTNSNGINTFTGSLYVVWRN